MRLELDVFGAEDPGGLEAFGERVADVRPAWPAVIDVLLDANRRHFDSQGAGAWPELSPRYAAQKAREGDPRMLRVTGALFDSLTKEADRGQRREERPTELTLGTIVRHARLVAKRRPVLGVVPTTRRTVRERLRGFLSTGRL